VARCTLPGHLRCRQPRVGFREPTTTEIRPQVRLDPFLQSNAIKEQPARTRRDNVRPWPPARSPLWVRSCRRDAALPRLGLKSRQYRAERFCHSLRKRDAPASVCSGSRNTLAGHVSPQTLPGDKRSRLYRRSRGAFSRNRQTFPSRHCPRVVAIGQPGQTPPPGVWPRRLAIELA
jgi:hypothetical protein